jgi:diguanylate cyclase (GGDEF)-like protein/PAS domain S-box-containing protein
MNQVAESLIGTSFDSANGKPFDTIFDIIDEKEKTPLKNLVKDVLGSKEVAEITEALLLSKTGFEIPIEARTSPIINSEGSITGTVTVFRDYTEKRQKQKEVEYLSLHDHLTGLYNRRYMEDALKRLDTKRNLPFTIMVIDINGLKLTNDAFGHATGDMLLTTVSDLIRNTCRADDIISRVGGDEFVLLLPKTDKDEADRIKHRLIEASDDLRLDSLVVSLAIGYCVKTDPDQNILEVQRIADNNMYKNKLKHGKIMRSQTIETVLRNINHKYDKEQIHTERVSLYCVKLAKAMGLGQKDIEKLRIAGILHDIGKIMVPADVLNKESKLTKDEWDEIRRHPVTSYNILKGVEEYAGIAELVLYHHERWDGNGYPQKLKGEEIPPLSRILTVADAYEAMTARRNYQRSRTIHEAAAEMQSCAGTQFDPDVVRVFIEKVI